MGRLVYHSLLWSVKVTFCAIVWCNRAVRGADGRRIVPENDPCRTERTELYACLQQDPRIDQAFDHACDSCVTHALPVQESTPCPTFEALFCNAHMSCPVCDHCPKPYQAFWACIVEVQSNFACSELNCHEFARVDQPPSLLESRISIQVVGAATVPVIGDLLLENNARYNSHSECDSLRVQVQQCFRHDTGSMQRCEDCLNARVPLRPAEMTCHDVNRTICSAYAACERHCHPCRPTLQRWGDCLYRPFYRTCKGPTFRSSGCAVEEAPPNDNEAEAFVPRSISVDHYGRWTEM